MDNQKARELFYDNGAGIHNHTIIGASLDNDRLVLQIDGGYPDGRYALEIHAAIKEQPPGNGLVIEPVIEIDFDEPAGAGADPYGRPDPTTHPEFWRE